MTNLLRDTLTERADNLEPPPLDLDGIVAAGNRQISRRRALTVLGGAVATAAVAVGGATLIRSRRPQPVRPAPYVERRAATFAVGNKIHYGADVITTQSTRINAFVQTDAGFVFLDEGNNIHVADRATGKGAWSLTADHRGNLVAWVEGFNDHAESVVYDVAEQRELVRTPIGNAIPPNVSLAFSPTIVALDGNTAYFGTLKGLYRWNLGTNRGDLIANVAPNAVRTVTAGQLVYQQPLVQPIMGHTLRVGPTLTSGTRTTFTGQQAFLSPDARYLVTQPADARMGDQPVWSDLQLFGVTTRTVGRLPGTYAKFLFGQWLDNTTFTAAGVRSDVVDLLTINAETGAHTVVAPEFSTYTFSTTAPRILPFAMPTGASIYDVY
ncbi:hypothetical protein [Kribbella jiaozuonensis]|uniref:Uncharacterized protein n=1 Tax=Kribbella jiaozuonensis TaxID=2575441 RepID=A0A4U3LNV9_9ACTN|nr:hypothetical protein [Kribbella jiaozuonensis]TKK76017.1 hypothetical protein FDA38_26690 [Kribbella jiaozuonensis]